MNKNSFLQKYEATYKVSFAVDREADEDDDEADPNVLSPEDQKQLASIFGTDKTPKTPKEAVPALTNKVKEQEQQIETLGQQQEPPTPVEKVKASEDKTKIVAVTLGHVAHTQTHLFGIEDPLFARGKWYNEITVNRSVII